MKPYKILAIIPARGGSKGIKRKNLQKLSGKPLIVHTIIAAKKTKSINKIIVSTDDKEISRISQNNGAEVPFLRPKQISKDTSSTIEVIKHALKFLEKNQSYVPDIIILLDDAMVSHATLASVSLSKIPSSIASDIQSQTLSGCPSVTDSEVK